MSRQAIPEYQRAADVIKSRLGSVWAVGSLITVPEIKDLTGTTYSTARVVAERLQAEGILQAHPGKGFAIVAMPEEADAERADAKELARQVDRLRKEVRELSARLEAAESDIEDVFDKLGFDHADGNRERAGEPAPAARRGRTG